MANAHRVGIIITLVVFIVSINACSKICDEGYEGKRCDIEMREKFEGQWHATDNPGGLTFTDTISKGNAITDVLILRRFGADTFNRAVKATINASSITIAKQKPDSGRELYIEGTGALSDDEHTINW